MIGLLYLVFFAVYLWLSILLIRWAARIAKKRGITGWKFGLPMALVMYLLVFWDWIPTVVAHKYYCSKYGGFTVYKTLDEWKKENPGVAEMLHPEQLPEKYFVKEETRSNRSKRRFYKLPNGTELISYYNVIGEYLFTHIRRDDGISSYWLNQRFSLDIFYDDEVLGIVRREDRVVDMNTGEVLARYANFSTNIDGIIGAENIRDYKVWMSRRLCEPEGGGHPQRMEFNGFFQSIKNMWEEEEHEQTL